METTLSTSLRLENLRKDFRDTAAVDGITLDVPEHAFLVLLGPSGCGKTTTLRMLAGLENPTGGEINFGGRTIATGDGSVIVPPAQREAGLVFQSYALWPHKTVRENISWPLRVAGWQAARMRSRVAEVLELLAITDLADRYPGEISGGQQQRVAIARTIAPEPRFLFFDEPLSNLDAKLRVDTRGELVRIHRATRATSVYVTHDQVEAMTMATHIALLKDGRIEQFGTPQELLARPATAFTATFIGTPPANVLPGVVDDGRVSIHGVMCAPAPHHVSSGTRVQVMYRPGSLQLSSDLTDPRPGLAAGFADQVPMADRWVIGVDLSDGGRMSVTLDHRVDLVPGDPVRVLLPELPDAFFDEHGDRIPGEDR